MAYLTISQRQRMACSSLATSTCPAMKETLLPYHGPVAQAKVNCFARWIACVAAVALLLSWVSLVDCSMI
jgi:hypothetical protein